MKRPSDDRKKFDRSVGTEEQYRALRERIDRLPIVRENKVLQLKQLIDSGAYTVNTIGVAAVMLAEY